MPIEPGSTLACLKIQIFLGSSAIQQSFKLYAVRRSKVHQGNEMIVLVPIISMEVEQEVAANWKMQLLPQPPRAPATVPEALENELLGRMLYGSPGVYWAKTTYRKPCKQNDRGSLILPTPFRRIANLTAPHIQCI